MVRINKSYNNMLLLSIVPEKLNFFLSNLIRPPRAWLNPDHRLTKPARRGLLAVDSDARAMTTQDPKLHEATQPPDAELPKGIDDHKG